MLRAGHAALSVLAVHSPLAAPAQPANGPLSGPTALLLLTGAIMFILLCTIAWDSRNALLHPAGCLIAPLAMAIFFFGAQVIAYPANFLINGTGGLSRHADVWPMSIAAVVVALVFARRFRSVSGNTPWRVLARAALLLASCAGAKYLAYLAGLPVSRFWIGGAVALGAMTVCVATWQLADLWGNVHLLVRAGLLVVGAGLVAAWSHANGFPVLGVSGPALWTTLLVLPLVTLAGILLLIYAWRTAPLPPSVRERIGERFTGDLDRAGRTPAAHEIWNAFVPFNEEEPEGKDRPVLVLRVAGDQVDVLTITSQDKSRFDEYLALPVERCRGVLAKDSWLELKVTQLTGDCFRSFRGLCPTWVWAEVRRRGPFAPEHNDAGTGSDPHIPPPVSLPPQGQPRGPRSLAAWLLGTDRS